MIRRSLAFAAAIAAMTSHVAYAAPVFTVQLGSFESEDAAAAHWRSVKDKYSGQLSGLQPQISSLTLPPDNKTTYRVQAGPLSDVDEARDICALMQAADDRCFVVETAMFRPTNVPAPAVQQVAAAAPEPEPLPFDPERSAEFAAAEPIEVPEVPSMPDASVRAAADAQAAEARALSDAAAKTNKESNSLFDRLNPFSSDDDDAPALSEEEEKARLTLNESLNTAPAPVTLKDVDNAEVAQRRAELEDARAKLNAMKQGSPIPTPTPAAEPVFTPPVPTRQEAPVPPAFSEPMLDAPEERSVALAKPAFAPEVKAPMEPSVSVNEAPLATLERPAPLPAPVIAPAPIQASAAPQPYIPPMPPRDQTPSAFSTPVIASSPAPTAPPLGTTEPIIRTAPSTSPQTLGTITRAPQYEAPLQTFTPEPAEADVRVAEAIRVPVTTAQTPPTKLVPVAPSIADMRHHYKTSPSSPVASGNLWAEIRYFESREAAMSYWQGFNRFAVGSRPLRVRTTQPVKQASDDQPNVSLRAGPFNSKEEIAKLCSEVRQQKGYQCGAMNTTNTAAIAPIPGVSRAYSRPRSATLQRNAYEAKRGFMPANGREAQTAGYWIQIGSYASPDRAVDAWERFQTAYAPALDGMMPHILEPHMSSGQQPVFRLRAGPYQSYTVAQDVCGMIKAKRGLCLIARQ